MSPLCGSGGEGSVKGQCRCLASGVFLGWSSVLALTLLLATQFLPICHWCPSSSYPASQWGWVCTSPKSIGGPFRWVFWEPCSFFCCPNLHWVLQPEVVGIYLPGSGTLGWEVWCGAGIPRSTGFPCSRGVPSHFYLPHMGVGPPVLHLCVSAPPTCLDECDFFNSIVVRLPFNSISDGSK